MFVRIPINELVIDTKYKITVCIPNHIEFDKYSGILKQSRINQLKFEKLYDLIKQEYSTNAILIDNTHRAFYRFVSDNSQWKMERRSVNMIIRRLIGDDNFEW